MTVPHLSPILIFTTILLYYHMLNWVSAVGKLRFIQSTVFYASAFLAERLIRFIISVFYISELNQVKSILSD